MRRATHTDELLGPNDWLLRSHASSIVVVVYECFSYVCMCGWDLDIDRIYTGLGMLRVRTSV